MALNSYPVYNILHEGRRLRCVGHNGVAHVPPAMLSGASVGRQGTSLKRTMDISIPATRPGDGLRPVDLSRDLSQVIELLKMAFGESLDGDGFQYFGDGTGPMNEILYRFNPVTSRLSNGFVWQADGRIVGNVTLLTTKAWDRYLVANVAVHPSYRRRGIARGLMQAVMEAIRKQGGRTILLQVVKDNQPALDLYRSLGYVSIGNMASWSATRSRVRQIHIDSDEQAHTRIDPLPGRLWREAFELDTAHVYRDLNWPEPLSPDAYRRTWWQRFMDFTNGRQVETWITADPGGNLSGLVNIACEWGRSNMITLRVRPDYAGRLERPLLAKIIRRLQYLPRRNLRIDHPEVDEHTSQLLNEANFSIQRTLTHMRLDLS